MLWPMRSIMYNYLTTKLALLHYNIYINLALVTKRDIHI